MFKYPPIISSDKNVCIGARIPSRFKDLLTKIGNGNIGAGLNTVLFSYEKKIVEFVAKLEKTDKNHDKKSKQTVKKKTN